MECAGEILRRESAPQDDGGGGAVGVLVVLRAVGLHAFRFMNQGFALIINASSSPFIRFDSK